MTSPSLVVQLPLWPDALWPPRKSAKRPSLHSVWLHPESLPAFVRDCPPAMRTLDLLGPLD